MTMHSAVTIGGPYPGLVDWLLLHDIEYKLHEHARGRGDRAPWER